MMIHEKLISGQFLLDIKNDRSGLLSNHHHNQHNLGELHAHRHQPQSGLSAHYVNHHHQSPKFQQQPPSPPMSANKMDIYTAYAYHHHHQQQQLMNNKSEQDNYSKGGALDLSRRCDSVETPRKTPSPGHTNSSIGTASPAASPSNSKSQSPQQSIIVPANLLYSAQAQQNAVLPNGALYPALPAGLASIYPALYYSSGGIKSEPLSTSSPSSTPPPQSTQVQLTTPNIAVSSSNSQLPLPAASDLLQTFATAAAAVVNTTPAAPIKATVPVCKSPITNTTLSNVPTSPHLSSIGAIDAKNTRPFKAFPRDPLVIAANFAATDVLLDNPRVERYTEYRKRVLEQIRNSNGGTRTITNPKMRRTNSRNTDFSGGSTCRSSSEERQEDDNKADSKINVTSIDESSDCDSNAGSFADHQMASLSDSQNGKISSNGVVKDAAYYERRRKNNAAAKKSRDRRRIKEDEIAIRAAYLERQNIELLCQIDALKAQIAAFTSKVGA